MSKKEDPPFGAFALVSYVPDPLGSFLDSLRRTLPGENQPQSHITVVPPRPLEVPLEIASEFAQETLEGFPSFRVVLGNVHCFPETNVLYLDLARGQEEVHRLHDELNKGVLAHKERFEFRPHLTIGGPVEKAEIPAFQQRLSELWPAQHRGRDFPVLEIVALWYDGAAENGEWSRVWSRRLRTAERWRATTALSDQTL